MKVYAAPEGITLTPDYSNYNRVEEQRKEDEYKAAIKKWLVENGYNGPLTGEVASFGVADGYAQYMLGDKGRGGILIHLDIGDAWHYQYIERLTKADIVKSIERDRNMKALFAKR